MKLQYLFAGIVSCQIALAQPAKLPASISATNEKTIEEYFNTDKVRLLSAKAVPINRAVLIAYEKTDTLSFKHTFFQPSNFISRNYILQGLALYEKKADGYYRQFANDQALFCASCNNMQSYSIQIHKDTISISIAWGPSVAGVTDTYSFLYDKASNRWPAWSVSVSGADDANEERRVYKQFRKNAGLFLNNYVAEMMPYSAVDNKVDKGITLYYHPNDYKALLDSLYAVPQAQFKLLPHVFSANDAAYFTEQPITKKEVENANNIGFFLLQVNALPAAEVFLKKVLEAFPKREVAWYNLGDVCLKNGRKTEAVRHYNTYINLMTERGKQEKIPQKLRDFMAANQP